MSIFDLFFKNSFIQQFWSVSQSDKFHHYKDIPVIKTNGKAYFFDQFCVEGCGEAIILLYLKLYLINLDF